MTVSYIKKGKIFEKFSLKRMCEGLRNALISYLLIAMLNVQLSIKK